MRNEVKYGLRFLVRDTLNSERRVRSLLAHERLPREQLDAVTDELLTATLQAAVRRIPRYKGMTASVEPGRVREGLAGQFPIVEKHDLTERPAEHSPHGHAPRPWTIVGRTSGTSGTPLQVFRSL